MKVIRLEDVELEVSTSKLMVGQVRSHRFEPIDGKAGQGLSVGLITFSPGAKNVLHTHTGEQLLYIVEGKGIVATETEERVVTPGMLVRIPPGEKHWHGATKDSSFSHLSVQMPGKTEF
jgi:quercetin dioxygenase-like cupin family protein